MHLRKNCNLSPTGVPEKLEVFKCKQSRKLITARIIRLAEVN